MEIEDEVKIWETLAAADVAQAKEMKQLQNLFLLTMINAVTDIFSKENPYVLPQNDIIYRTYVVNVLSEAKRQELPNYEGLAARVIMPNINNLNQP